MTWLMIVGWAAGVIGSAYSLPQLVKVVRARTTAGLSLFAWQLGTGCALGWSLHGLIAGSVNILVCNLVIMLADIGVVAAIQRENRLPSLRTWLPCLVLGLALAGVDLRWGAAAFGLAILVPGSVSLVAMIRAIVTEPVLAGVSPGFLAFGSGIQVLWLIWGAGAHDAAILIGCGSTLVLLLAALGCYLARTAGWRGLGRAARPRGPVSEPVVPLAVDTIFDTITPEVAVRG